ncbi:hypothetical protein [Nocardia shimofusensis]|uniref:hypothetical protein n=1 Tax=Nocardia shimofusensis TaxID=228596 RepID=UPI00082D71DD|nr:hypothetical protein [Nocardia shimofusensis]
MSQKEPYTRERVSFGAVASAALLALIVIVGVVVYISRDEDAAGGGQAELAATVGEGFATPEVDLFGRRVDIPNNAAGQPLPQDPARQRKPSDLDWLTARPAGLDQPRGWQRVYGASVPFSTSDGPARLEEGQPVGYAHTPQGAVLAAAQITYRLNARPADRELYVRQVRASAQQLAEYDRAMDQNRLPEQQPERITRYFVAPDAFQVESYADDLAVVRFASRGQVVDDRQLWVALRLVMVWEAGDWRLKPATAEGSRTEYIESLAGWTTW